MDPLIQLRRLGGAVFALNPDLIERAEATPDTVVTLVGGNKYVILESLDELTLLIQEHRTRILADAELLAMQASQPAEQPVPPVRGIASSPGARSQVVPIRPQDT
ncbi:flagellar FlbD family protein [Rhodococcus sp. X156]|uniref:flagellar FlbD family protein n=1 Tax=Rhodococcus sp. X156 TaxID=2499145 RepID=UPI000FD76410|nr:flagellar FlbD family protein [Rhodococcus sp. X156]